MKLKKISKNCYIDRLNPIKDINDVIISANKKEALYHTNWGIKPAMVLLHMQMNSIVSSVNKKMLYKIIKLEIIMKTKPFDLELAKQGHPLIDGYGRSYINFRHDKSTVFFNCCAFDVKKQIWVDFNSEGKYYSRKQDKHDLLLDCSVPWTPKKNGIDKERLERIENEIDDLIANKTLEQIKEFLENNRNKVIKNKEEMIDIEEINNDVENHPVNNEVENHPVNADYLNLILKICEIELNTDLLQKVLDVQNLLKEKGNNATLKDFYELKDKWNSK